jgi:hypothetical protein
VLLKEPSLEALTFGCIYKNYPNLLQSFRIDAEKCGAREVSIVAARLMQWSRIAEVIGFDEWIQNVDRNLQNILWDGFDEFVLIDHGLTLGLAPSTHADVNKLLIILLTPLHNDMPAITKLKESVLEAAVTFHASFASDAAASMSAMPLIDASINTNAFVTFVNTRLPQVVALLLQRFPSPQLRLELINGRK